MNATSLKNDAAERPEISDLILERYLLGELPEGQLAAIRSRIAAEPLLLQRVARLEASNRELLEKHPVRPIIAAIRERAEAGRPHRVSFPLWQLGLVPAAVVALLVAVNVVSPGSRSPLAPPASPLGDEVRFKGSPHLSAVLVRNGVAEKLLPGASARTGDKVQLAYVAAGKRFGVVLSIDGRGGVTLHLPQDSTEAAPLSQGEIALPSAYVLDDAPAFERFVFVTSDASSFAPAMVLDAARALATKSNARTAPIELPAALEQHDLVLNKVYP